MKKKMSLAQFVIFIESYNANINIPLIRRAYEFSDKAHDGQFRESGDHFIEHCLEVAFILAELHMDSATIAAGLIHDVVEDTAVSIDEIKKELRKSDSRVRSHIKTLNRKGMIRCVGKAKVKKFSPSRDGLEAMYSEIFEDPKYDDLEDCCIAGECMTSGCSRVAEDYWRDGYYCRGCIIGLDVLGDRLDIKKWHEKSWVAPSGAGQVLEMVQPSYSDDISLEDEIDLDNG